MKYFLYARKSTEDEERQVMSIEAQLSELADYAKRENIIITERFIESKSAKKPGREIFNEMIAKIHNSKEPIGIMAWHPDRLARNSIDGGQIIYLVDTGKIVSLRFPTFWCEPTPQGMFMLQVAFGQSKYYSDNLSENVKRGFRQKIKRGEWLNMAPFGYINNAETRNIEPHPTESRIVQKIFEEFITGEHTLKSVRERLIFWNVLGKLGKHPSISQVQRMLTNPAYIGLIKFNGEAFEGKFQPILPVATFEAVQKILKDRAKPRKSKIQHIFPFRGLLKCGECGAAITAQYAHGNGGTYRYYRCTKRLGPCSQKFLQEYEVAEQIKEQLQQVAISDAQRDQAEEKINEWEKEENKNNSGYAQNLENGLSQAEQKLDKLVSAYLDGDIEKETYLKRKEELIKTKKDMQEQKSDFGRQGHDWFKPMREFIFSAHLAKKLASSNDLIEIKSLVEKIGTNRHLAGQKVSWLWKKPYDILADRTACPTWLRGPDLNRRPRGYGPRELPGCSTPLDSVVII